MTVRENSFMDPPGMQWRQAYLRVWCEGVARSIGAGTFTNHTKTPKPAFPGAIEVVREGLELMEALGASRPLVIKPLWPGVSGGTQISCHVQADDASGFERGCSRRHGSEQ
jgi:hypothetical protein